MRRKNDTLASKVNRMGEFYDSFDLDTFDDFIGKRKYNVEESWTFLDMQTRCDYLSCQGTKDPLIYDYIARLDDHFKDNANHRGKNGKK